MTVSGTQPDNPRPTVCHRNGCGGCEHPENAYPPCWTDEQMSADQARMRRLMLGEPDGRDSVETGAGSAVSGLSGSRRDHSGSESGQDGSGQLRAQAVLDLARTLDRGAVDATGSYSLAEFADIEHRRNVAVHYAQLAVDAGWVRVSVDDATVDRVAAVLATDDAIDWDYIQSSARDGSKWAQNVAARFRSLARAAVQALLGGVE